MILLIFLIKTKRKITLMTISTNLDQKLKNWKEDLLPLLLKDLMIMIPSTEDSNF